MYHCLIGPLSQKRTDWIVPSIQDDEKRLRIRPSKGEERGMRRRVMDPSLLEKVEKQKEKRKKRDQEIVYGKESKDRLERRFS